MLEEEHEETMGKLRRVEDIAARERARADSNSSDALEAQVAAWKEEADKGRRAVLELEAERGELQESCAKLAKQVEELEAVVKDARGAANSDLSRRHKEVTDLLYLKQTQLEKMAAEKAAAQLSLEREVMGLREELEKSRRKASSARDPIETYGAEMTPMDTIGAYYTRLANDERLGGAVKAFAKVRSSLPVTPRVFCWLHVTYLIFVAMLQNQSHKITVSKLRYLNTGSGI
jgi:chromosome segregation ATPase